MRNLTPKSNGSANGTETVPDYSPGAAELVLSEKPNSSKPMKNDSRKKNMSLASPNGRSESFNSKQLLKVLMEGKNGNFSVRIPFDEVGLNGKIFDMFVRLHGNSEYEGTGIGLALYKEIVDKHEGFISVLSKENTGSTFIVSFPMQ